jgi:hypothetical protein
MSVLSAHVLLYEGQPRADALTKIGVHRDARCSYCA